MVKTCRLSRAQKALSDQTFQQQPTRVARTPTPVTGQVDCHGCRYVPYSSGLAGYFSLM